MFEPSVSVIVNTYNRAYHLKRLLDHLSKQRYEKFEVIVVNGPSVDGTEKILQQYKKAIRIEECPHVNLGMSRNVGVVSAASDIIVFIDDDALPGNEMWLEELIKPFQAPIIGAVGGCSFRMDGNLEFSHGICSIYGENVGINFSGLSFDEQTGEYFNGVIGCNCAFRRSSVLEVGGFDEFYKYHMEETDLCYRLTRAGYKIVHNDFAIVRHEGAKSVNRKSKFNLNWRAIARSSTYFVMKATGEYHFPENRSIKIAEKCCELRQNYFVRLRNENLITESDFKLFQNELNTGISEGISAGIKCDRILIHNIKHRKFFFRKYNKNICRNHRNVCYLCLNDVPVWIKQVSQVSTKIGNNIFIVSVGEKNYVENKNGVNYVSFIPNKLSLGTVYILSTSQERQNLAYNCIKKLFTLNSYFFFDRVECFGSRLFQQDDIPVFNKKILFTTDSEENNIKYLKSGFSYPESGFTWTDGKQAEMFFILPDIHSELILQMDYLTFCGSQTVSLFVNDRLLEKYTAFGEEKKQVIIPQKDLIIFSDDEKSFRMLLLRFELPDARSPKSISMNMDGRFLALAMKSIVLGKR